MYEPREDSFLLQKEVKKHAKGDVLDIGTGTGFQAIAAAKCTKVKKVLAVDIDKNAADYCRKNIKLKSKKIRFAVSDLFSNVNGKFDTITFNPPYLPREPNLKDIALDGGKKGYELVERFLNNVSDYLKPDGIVLLLFSSLTNKNKVDKIIESNALESEELSKMHIFFEDLFVYKITKTKLLQRLEKHKVKNIKYFAKGKRGLIYTGMYKNKKVAVKTKRKESLAVGRIKNERKYLKMLNKHKIGPSLLFFGDNFIGYEFVEGVFIKDYIEKAKKKDIKKVLKNVFEQCYKLDKLAINKEEMHRPFKHVVIGKDPKNITMLDFERAHKTKEPKNVTQFFNYAMNVLKADRKKAIELAKNYKRSLSRKALNNILSFLKIK